MSRINADDGVPKYRDKLSQGMINRAMKPDYKI